MKSEEVGSTDYDIPNGDMAHIVKHYDNCILISFHIKSLAARIKLIMMNEGSLDQCTLSYPFLACARSSFLSVHCIGNAQLLCNSCIHFHDVNELTNQCLS